MGQNGDSKAIIAFLRRICTPSRARTIGKQMLMSLTFCTTRHSVSLAPAVSKATSSPAKPLQDLQTVTRTILQSFALRINSVSDKPSVCAIACVLSKVNRGPSARAGPFNISRRVGGSHEQCLGKNNCSVIDCDINILVNAARAKEGKTYEFLLVRFFFVIFLIFFLFMKFRPGGGSNAGDFRRVLRQAALILRGLFAGFLVFWCATQKDYSPARRGTWLH